MTEDVYEYCPHCEHEAVVKWDIEADGLQIFCPYCGKPMMLCSECPVRDNEESCDWQESIGCRHSNERYRKYYKEEKMEFTKDMLKSGEHVVEYRSGSRALYLNGFFVSEVGYMELEHYDDNLMIKSNEREEDEENYDIMAVYQVTKYYNLNYILYNSNKVVWERNESFIKIPSSEAFAKLKEIYGKEVKIVEDKDE